MSGMIVGSGFLQAISRELAKYKFDLVSMQEVILHKVALNQQTII
jgi:hypothetical protein